MPRLNKNNKNIQPKIAKLSKQDVSRLKKQIGHICQISDTVNVGSIPFVPSEIFGNSHYFCVDSGSAVSILGVDMLKYINPKQLDKFTFQLNTANRSPVKVFGKAVVQFNLGDHSFVHEFVFADVSKNFLGADFLRKYDVWLNVDQVCM